MIDNLMKERKIHETRKSLDSLPLSLSHIMPILCFISISISISCHAVPYLHLQLQRMLSHASSLALS